jgi:predicted TIM-barrel fold metal-dependent hydrolase
MRTIDFHLHLSPKADTSVEKNISEHDLRQYIKSLSRKLEENDIMLGNVIFIDETLLKKEKAIDQITSERRKNLVYSCMIDPRDKDSMKLVERANSLGFRGLKLHPYHQRLSDAEMPSVEKLARRAEELGMFIVVDCSYLQIGYEGLKLVTSLSESTGGAPILIAHGGGSRVLDAIPIVTEKKNVFLELSFSIQYWLGSTVEQDFAFAIRKVGSEKCVYGSDAPYVDISEYKKTVLNFLRKHGFGDEDIENIMYNTSKRILGK